MINAGLGDFGILGRCSRADADAANHGAVLASGVYDLKPLQHSFLHSEIGLTDDETARWSPLRINLPTGTNAAILVGENETLPFKDQAQALAQMLRTEPVITLPGANHMSVVHDLGTSGTVAAEQLERLIREH